MADGKLSEPLLLKAYEAAIAEVRFNIQLGWDRTKFYLTLNAGLLAAGIGLTEYADKDPTTSGFLSFFFVLTMVSIQAGIQAGIVAKGYYREAVLTKTLIERDLGLLQVSNIPGNPPTTYSIAVTDGQRDHEKILRREQTPVKRFKAPASITDFAAAMLWVMFLIALFGALSSAANIGLYFAEDLAATPATAS